jgi:polygalacturonase
MQDASGQGREINLLFCKKPIAMLLRKWMIMSLLACISLTLLAQQPAWVSKVGARSFPKAKKNFFVNDYGAVADGITVNSASIQKAIDACAASGGGVVSFRPGTYVMGSVFIKSNVEFRIDKDVLILGSQDFADYPEIDTRIAGIEMKWPAALINLIGVTNAAVTGTGVVNARGKFCWDKYWSMRREYDAKGLRWIVDYDAKRVRTLLVQHSSDITLQHVTFKNAGFWTVQLLYSDHLTVDGLVIRNNEDGHGPSTDGIDIDSSSWTLVENCDIDCNDDNFCLKAGRDWDGLRVNRPTEYIVIRKSLARRGAGLVTLGSETSGGIRHVLATDLVAKNTDNGLRIKSAITRGGVIEDIYFRNSVLDSVKNVFQYNLNWNPSYSYSELPEGYDISKVPAHWRAMLQKVEPAEKGIPHAKDVFIDNIRATHAQSIFGATGLESSYLTNFVYGNSRLSGNVLGLLEYTRDWIFKDVSISVEKKAAPAKPVSKEVSERLQ